MSEEVINGTKQYVEQEIESVKVNGTVKLRGTTVKRHLEVNGQLKAEDAEIKAMQINGKAALSECSVQSESTVCGALVAVNSKFMNGLVAITDKVILDSCQLKSLYIPKLGWPVAEQVVELKGSTTVYGDITFESGKGFVIISDSSSVKGSILGGSVLKKNN